MEQIKYRKGYKYQLAKDYTIKTGIIGYTADTHFIILTSIGVLIIKKGYSWDGASGPTVDTKSTMRGSLVHDALYQLMRWELIPQEERQYADELLSKICKEDGMTDFRADYWEFMTKKFAHSAATPDNKKKILEAPIG